MAQPAPRQRPLVLIVDDEPGIVTAFSRMLESDGYATVPAHTAEDAIGLLRNGVRPDAIVLDLRMPGLGGLGFLLSLRAHTDGAEIPVAVVTADTHLDDTTRQAVGALGATLWYKPVDVDQLTAIMGRLVVNRPTVSPAPTDCAPT